MSHLPNDPAHGNSGPGGPLPTPEPADKAALSPKRRPERNGYRETPDVSAAVCRLIRAIGRRASCGDPEDLAELLKVADTVQAALRVAVDGLRCSGRSDTEIGRVLGVTKQAVAQRFPQRRRVMLTPAGVVAVKTLAALGIVDKAHVQQALILWARPSPRLAPADTREILATFPEPQVGQVPADFDDGEYYHRNEPETGGSLPPHVGGYPLGGRNRQEPHSPGPEEANDR